MTFHQVPTPQAIFVLGGDFARTRFAEKFWLSHRDLDIWISDFPQYLDEHQRIFRKFGVLPSQLHLDSAATDTVTNFTNLVEDFVADNTPQTKNAIPADS